MDRYILPRLQEQYFSSREREPRASYLSEPYSPSFRHPPFSYMDLALLREILAPQEPEYTSLADQVFGRQARHEGLSLHLLVNLLYQRSFLHEKHLRDIQHRHTDCQDKLSVLRMLFPVADSRLRTSMESLVVQLEREEREEELTFWKDTASLRKDILEEAGEYRAARDRLVHLGSLEMNYG